MLNGAGPERREQFENYSVFLLIPTVVTHRIWKDDKLLINELRSFSYLTMAWKKIQPRDGKEIMRKILQVHR